MKTITVYSDPSHGWAKVRRSELAELGLLTRISRHSYQSPSYARTAHVFLEGDADLTLYVEALQARGTEFVFREKHTDRSSRIRSYEPFWAKREEREERGPRYLTNAPEAYDYGYVSTVEHVTDRYGKPARIVETRDLERFKGFQIPRYNSGLHLCHPLGGEDANYLLEGSRHAS